MEMDTPSYSLNKFLITARTSAKLPREVVHSLRLGSLNPVAIKCFLLVVALYQLKQQSELPEIRFLWKELHAYISEDIGKIAGSYYQRYKDALDAVVGTTVAYSYSPPAGNTKWVTVSLFSKAFYDEETGEVVVELGKHFSSVLALMGNHNYALVYLQEAAKLHDSRQLRMLLWCYEFRHLVDDRQRVVSLEMLRQALDFSSPSYNDWRSVSNKLNEYTSAINTRTNLKLKLIPIKRGKRVIAVQFDVTGTRRLTA